MALMQQDQDSRNTAKMFEVGKQVPNFVVEDAQGNTFDLYRSLNGRKATLLNFWTYGLESCVNAALPYFQELYDEHFKNGLGVIAVNDGDLLKWVVKYVDDNKLTFPVVLGGKGEGSLHETIGVHVYPTTYLLDSKGRVIARYAWTEKSDIDAALKRVGF